MCVCPVGVLSVSRCVSPLFQGARKQLQCKRPSRFNAFTAPLYFVLSSLVDTVETVRGTREIAGCSIPGRFTVLSHRVLDGGCIFILYVRNNNNNNLTNSYWSIGSTMNVKEDRAQTREMGGMETQFQCG